MACPLISVSTTDSKLSLGAPQTLAAVLHLSVLCHFLSFLKWCQIYDSCFADDGLLYPLQSSLENVQLL